MLRAISFRTLITWNVIAVGFRCCLPALCLRSLSRKWRWAWRFRVRGAFMKRTQRFGRASETLYGEGDHYDSFLLSGKTIGLVGFGNLGRALLPLVKAFGGEILVCDPWIHPAVLREAGVTPASLEECFRRSSVVFLLAATTTENAGKIDRTLFDVMPSGAVLVLVSRAGIVNFDDLLDAAGSGRIRVAIDVWPEEPIPANHRARSTRNTLAAGASRRQYS